MRHLNQNKMVRTNVQDYLAEDAHVLCISCVDCIKKKGKILQYRYHPAIKTDYGEHFTQFDAQKQQIWNLDRERRKLKVPYKAPGTFESTYLATYQKENDEERVGGNNYEEKKYKLDRLLS